jgi:drug/metabolite transporter (DMT)-like permease
VTTAEPSVDSGPAGPRGPSSGLVGVLLVLAAAVLFSVNGTVSKLTLRSGLSALRLVEIRCLGAALVLIAIALLRDRRSMRAGWRELGLIAVYGSVGLALVQWLYFVSISRIPVSISLLIEFTAPLLTALWVRFVRKGEVRSRVWGALALVLCGLGLVSQVWSGISLDTLGVLAAVLAALSLASYYLLGERALGRRDPYSLAAWSFLAAALFWALLQPWWSFPFDRLDDPVALAADPATSGAPHVAVWALVLYNVLLGTVAPFGLTLLGLSPNGATRTGLVASTEPVLAGVIAWLVLDEVLTGWQVLGAAIVMAGIVLAETSRSEALPTAPAAL